MRLVLALLAFLLPGIAVAQAPDFGVPPTGAQNLAAAGTTQNTAFPVPAQINVFANVASGAGAILPATPANITVINNGANALLLYPSSGDRIDAGASNAPISIAAGSQLSVTMTDAPLSPRPHVWRSVASGAINLTSPGPIGTVTPGPITGTIFNGDGSSLTTLPTGASLARTDAAVQADATNVMNFTGIDPTGATNSTAAIQAAAARACASPIKSLFFPPGTYKLLTPLTLSALACNGLDMWGYPGTVTLLADATNTSNPRLFNTIRQNGVTVRGLGFDGNTAGGSTSTNSLIAMTGPMAHVTFKGNVCQNAPGNCMVLGNNGGINGVLSAQANNNQPVLTFASTPAGVGVGAYLPTTFVEPDMYVIASDATTVTLNRDLKDTLPVATAVHFTFSFQTNANVPAFATVIPTSSTTNLGVGMTISSGASFCIIPKTHILSIVANTSVTIDQATTCLIPSGTGIAAISGIQDALITENRFENLGMTQRNAGSLSVTTNGSTALGATQITFNCIAGSCAGGVGLIPGDLSSTVGLPTGMPASDLVIDGPTINTGAGTFTVTFANPTTAIIPTATSIPFKVGGPSGIGYAIFMANSASFANQDNQITNNTFRHTWSSPWFITASTNLLLQGNTYLEDFVEFQSPTLGASACGALYTTIDTRIIGDRCTGGTATGFETAHNIGLTMAGVIVSLNGETGVSLCGGRGYQISGSFHNNGQYLNHPITQNYPNPANFGISISPSCFSTTPGDISDVNIGPIFAGDTQVTPTQQWGVSTLRTAGTFTNVNIHDITAGGNTSGAINFPPALSACGGGSPALNTGATDTTGTITEGTTATGCVMTFASSKPVAPVCQVTSPNGTAYTSVATSTTALTIVNGSASGNVYTYRCAA